MPKINKPFSRSRIFTPVFGESLAIQSDRDASDINNIMSKYRASGMVDHFNANHGRYGDAVAIPYHDALNVVLAASEAFDTLPADVRKRFSNDPGEFLAFVENPDNHDEMIQMGLALPSMVPEQLDQTKSEQVGQVPQEPKATVAEVASGAAEQLPT